MPKTDNLQGSLDLLVMKILRRGPNHGFAIASYIQQTSDEVLRVEAGSLYPALHRMTEAGLLKAEWRMSEAGRRARFYELTAKGRRRLEAEEKRWHVHFRRGREDSRGRLKESRMGLWSRIKRTFRGGGHNAEIQEELQFHLHMDAAGGHSSRETHLRLGNVTRIEEETRAMGIVDWLDSALQDVRYGLRQLRKTPALVAAVVLSLGIGVGANTAIFSLVDAALLKPLPVKDPDSLRIVEWT